MIVQTIKVNDCTPQTIVIGRRGTYDTLQIAFDLSYLVESYGNGVAVLAVKRSQDESAYPAVVTQEDNTLTWTISDTDTYYVGSGECQLMWYVDGGLAKTIIYPMVVMRDILATAEEPPDGYENWIEHLTELGAETQQNAQNAAQSASEAEQAKDDAVDAKEASEEAARKATAASVHAPIIQNGYWYIWNDGQYVDTGVHAEGQKGDKGDTGEKGDTGNGIKSITKTGTSGLVDTYTVTYTDGTSTTFTVTNGAKGDKGDTGATGNGIASIEKTGTSGNVDTYTITYTNGQTVTFTVTNGAVSSVAGKTGAVVLDSGDIAYDESATYQAGSVGAELQEQNRQLSDLEGVVTDPTNGLETKAPVILETASGAIASFDDGANGMPIKKLVANIEPVQDLHGQDSPYPAGGGKNKVCDIFSQYTKPDNYYILPVDLSASSTWQFHATQVGSKISGIVFGIVKDGDRYSNFVGMAAVVNSDGNTFSLNVNVDSSFVSPKLVCYCSGEAQFNQIFANYHIQLEAGSTTTSYSPYSNICPISGHTGAEIEQRGVNVWDEEWENGGYDGNGNKTAWANAIRSANAITVFPDTRYSATFSSSIMYLYWYASDGSFIERVTTYSGNIFTSPVTAGLLRFGTNNDVGTTYNNDISINYPATNTEYHPYTGDQISVTFPETIYGGEDEAISGKLKSTMGMVDLGTLNWTLMPNDKHLFYAAIPGIKPNEIPNVAANIKSDRYKTVSASAAFGATQDYVIGQGITGIIGNVYIMVVNRAYSDAASFKTAMSGAQLVYEIAEPVEYDLTPQTLDTLYGTNNIWSSTGDTEVEYPCDTKLYIDGKLAELQATILENIGG